MNTCEYTLATLHGCGLRDQDLTRVFGKMIRRKVASFDDDIQWPLTPEKLLEVMDKGPIPELFNAIYYTVHNSGKLNEFGYAETQSHNAAIKIWSLASDWESLVTRRPNPKTTTMGLLIHRLTPKKSSTSYTSLTTLVRTKIFDYKILLGQKYTNTRSKCCRTCIRV